MTNEPSKTSTLEISTAVVVSGALVICLVIILRGFLPALLWSCILSIAFWPTYLRFQKLRRSGAWKRIWAPLLFTLMVGLAIATPVALGALEIGHESHVVMRWISQAQQLPPDIANIPFAGPYIQSWWQENAGNSAADMLRHVAPGQLMGWTRSVGIEILDRGILFVVTLASLFFLFRDGATLSARLLGFFNKTLGARSEHVLRQIVTAIHGTVDGLVLVGLAEGAVLGVAYGILGVPHPITFAIATSILAIIPMGAPLAFFVAALLLLGAGHTIAAIGLVIFGFIVLFVADHIVRPVLIGNAARIPFLLVLLGILGGLASLGLVGLFVGPALMAVVVTLWGDFTRPSALAA